MKWTKFRSTNDHSLGLSLFEMPWLSAVTETNGKANFKIKYLGPQGASKKWNGREHGTYVLFERTPLRVTEVVALNDLTTGVEPILAVVKEFLEKELHGNRDHAAKYLDLIDEVAHQAIRESREP